MEHYITSSCHSRGYAGGGRFARYADKCREILGSAEKEQAFKSQVRAPRPVEVREKKPVGERWSLDRILNAARAGQSVEKIAGVCGYSHTSVRKIFVAQGFSTRTHFEALQAKNDPLCRAAYDELLTGKHTSPTAAHESKGLSVTAWSSWLTRSGAEQPPHLFRKASARV